MTVTDEKYIALIPAANRQEPNFTRTVQLDVAVQVRVQNLIESMVPIFSVDTAVGDQLDIIGQWVGVTRNVTIPVTGIYFQWGGSDPLLGWGYGTWQPLSAPSTITTLPDDAYRTLIKAKIAANRWDGTTDSAYAIWDSLFTGVTILIVDNQDMSYALGIVGGILDSLTLALLTGGYIPLKPEGVRISEYFVAVNDGPLFAWDTDGEFAAGWDEGSWASELSPT